MSDAPNILLNAARIFHISPEKAMQETAQYRNAA